MLIRTKLFEYLTNTRPPFVLHDKMSGLIMSYTRTTSDGKTFRTYTNNSLVTDTYNSSSRYEIYYQDD